MQPPGEPLRLDHGRARPEGSPGSPSDDRAQLLAYVKRAVRVLVQTLMHAFGGGLKGAVLGWLLFVFVGLVLVAIIIGGLELTGYGTPTWIMVTGLVVTPASLGAAGMYAGGVRGLLGALTQQMAERKVVNYLYVVLRPAILRATSELRSKTGPITRSEVARRLKEATRERVSRALYGEDGPRGVLDRIERWLAVRMQRVLCAAALTPHTNSTDRDQAIAELEALTIERIEENIAEAILAFYAVQLWIAMALGVLAAAIPWLPLLAQS